MLSYWNNLFFDYGPKQFGVRSVSEQYLTHCHCILLLLMATGTGLEIVILFLFSIQEGIKLSEHIFHILIDLLSIPGMSG
jgi:hypothetical protein